MILAIWSGFIYLFVCFFLKSPEFLDVLLKTIETTTDKKKKKKNLQWELWEILNNS